MGRSRSAHATNSGDGCISLQRRGRGVPGNLGRPDRGLPAGVAQPLAMAVHELATNAIKHGALSAPGGCVEVAWSLDNGPSGTLRLRWAKKGGPPVTGYPIRRGFGTRVLDGVVRDSSAERVCLSGTQAGWFATSNSHWHAWQPSWPLALPAIKLDPCTGRFDLHYGRLIACDRSCLIGLTAAVIQLPTTISTLTGQAWPFGTCLHGRLLEFRGAGVLHGYLHAPRLNQLADLKPARVASG